MPDSMDNHAADLERQRHFLSGELHELLAEMPTLHLLPEHAQLAWEARKRDLVRRIEEHQAKGGV